MLSACWLLALTFSLAPDDDLAARLDLDTPRWDAPRATLRRPADATGQTILRLRLREPAGDYAPLSWRGDDTWYGSPYWSGPNWTRVGRDWQHPGEATPSVRCWRAPRAGAVEVTGRVRKLHLDGDGVRVSIVHNAAAVWQAELDGRDGTGREARLELTVRQGDTLRFVVEKRGQIFCDTTGWDPTVSYHGEPAGPASAAFGSAQGGGGWSYELHGSADGSVPQPRLLGLDRQGCLREVALTGGATVAWSADEFLPAWLLADGDRSGLVLRAAAAADLTADWGADGWLTVNVAAPGGLLLERHRGARAAGLLRLGAALAAPARDTFEQLTSSLRCPPDFDLLLLVQAEWRREDRLSETVDSYRSAQQAQAARLLALGGQPPAAAAGDLPGWRRHWLRTRLAKRDALLAQPLVPRGPLLFCRRAQPSYSHLVGQYFGWRQRPGGDLAILEQPGESLRARVLVGPQLPPGSFLEPTLSYDGQRVAFSYVETPAVAPVATTLAVNEEGDGTGYFHLWEIGVDGRGLRQLTSGRYDDLMPCWLPDGGMACVSTRRKAYSRCFGGGFSRRWHSYTLHRLEAAGEPRILSVNDVNEWFPTVGHDGRLLFARWDYIDRDAVTHQNLWAARPDGTNPVAVWGNAAPAPHCTFQAKPVPGSRRIVFIASAHHAITGGPLCLLDPAVDPNRLDAVRRLTPGPLPEAEAGAVSEYYNAPWPLSEDLFLIAYSADPLVFEGQHPTTPNPDHALGLYLLDAAGNRELLYRDGELSATNPQPLAARPAPPALPSSLPAAAPSHGELLLTDVAQGLGDVDPAELRSLRVVEVLPKTSWLANWPRIGIAGEENVRRILGDVPLQPDGSARFRLPALTPVLFQVLDRQGRAYQTMRSTTYLQPGERTACVGCHESPTTASYAPRGRPLALRQAAQEPQPGPLGGQPFSYPRLVQPILDRRCLPCHGGAQPAGGKLLTDAAHEGFSRSYWTLCSGDDPALVPRYAQRNQVQATAPGGQIGARGSRLLQLLADHHGVRLEDAERRTLAAWIDLNAVYRDDYAEPPAVASR
ncbi:MAG: hypothetical protein IT204_24365 [Fimbriimonadaceae bacterium]|nr:hypothetical protein [Fimbriimonadaceae bacterium]